MLARSPMAWWSGALRSVDSALAWHAALTKEELLQGFCVSSNACLGQTPGVQDRLGSLCMGGSAHHPLALTSLSASRAPTDSQQAVETLPALPGACRAGWG